MQRRGGIGVMEELPSDASHRSVFPLVLVPSTRLRGLPLFLRVVETCQLLLPALLQLIHVAAAGVVSVAADLCFGVSGSCGLL